MYEIRTESVLYITPKLAMSVEDFWQQQVGRSASIQTQKNLCNLTGACGCDLYLHVQQASSLTSLPQLPYCREPSSPVWPQCLASTHPVSEL